MPLPGEGASANTWKWRIQYLRLPTRRSFRLLEVKNKVLSIECSLENSEIGWHPEYTALPYTWDHLVKDQDPGMSLRRYWSLPTSTMLFLSCNAQTTQIIFVLTPYPLILFKSSQGSLWRSPIVRSTASGMFWIFCRSAWSVTVGDTYLHSIMHGKATDLPDTQRGVSQLVWALQLKKSIVEVGSDQ